MRLRTCRRCKGPGTFNTVPGQRICDRCRVEPSSATVRQRAWARARDEANMVLRERHEAEWQSIFDAEFERCLQEQETPPAGGRGALSGLAEGEGQTQASDADPGDYRVMGPQ